MNSYHDFLTQLKVAFAHPGGQNNTKNWIAKIDI